MKSDLSASKRFAPFLSLLGLLILLTAVTIFFSHQILADVTSTPRSPKGAFFALVLVLPVTLTGAFAYQIWLLFRDHRRGRPGTALKIRISLFFLLTTLLATLPQAALSLSFIDTAMNTWGNERWGASLETGLKAALDDHQERIRGLEETADSPWLRAVVRQALGSPAKPVLVSAVQDSNWKADAVQIFDQDGRIVAQAGRSEAFLPEGPLANVEGALPKQVRGELTILRQLRRIAIDATTVGVVVAVVLPASYEATTLQLTGALDTYHQLKRSSDAYRSLFFVFYLLLALPILLIALLMSFTQSDDLIRPLINLESATRRIAAGDYSTRLLSPARGELAFLADSFNAMTTELAASRTKLLQTEKITAWQEIARRLAHELRNPLTPIRLSAERILRRSKTDPDHLADIVEPSMTAILTEVVRLDTLLKEFAGFARLPAPQKTTVVLRPLVDDLLATYKAVHPELTISTEGLSPDAKVFADQSQMEQLFTNLFKNAVEAMDGAGSLTLVSNLVKKAGVSYCRVQIHDTGPGISPDVRDRVFQPYVTTKTEGTGLGLAIVERILFDHNGRVWFESQSGFGTTFFVELPEEKS